MKSVRQLIKEAETVKRHISAERDKLRNIISDLEDIQGTTDDCISLLEYAADSLSQYL